MQLSCFQFYYKILLHFFNLIILYWTVILEIFLLVDILKFSKMKDQKNYFENLFLKKSIYMSMQ